jgi:hypothetical protein
MTAARTTAVLSSLLLGVALFGWTAAGETSNPRLATDELPPEVTNYCTPASCADTLAFHANWVGRTPQGSLFVVSRAGCTPGTCSSWLIEKHTGVARALLELPSAFRFHRVTGRYPAIEYDARTDEHALRLRYEWNGSAYARTLAQRIYAVNGFECGTRDECRHSATRALQADDVDQAQQIWQQVDGVAWI